MDPLLELRFEDRGDVCWLSCRGELDLGSADRLRVAVRRLFRRGRRLVIDLSELTFLDSSGVVALVTLDRETARHGTRLQLHLGQGTPAAKAVGVMGLGDHLPLA